MIFSSVLTYLKNTKIDIYFLALKKKLPDSSLISIEDDQKNQGTLCMT